MDFTKITYEELFKLNQEGKVVLVEIMRGQSVIKFEGQDIGAEVTDTFSGERIVSVGGRELARFTDR